MEEKEILNLIEQKQFEKAFNAIVDAYSKPLYFHARSIVLNHEEAHDALQNSFVKIWKGLTKFKGDSKIYTWTYRIVTNQSLDQLRKLKTHTTTHLESVNEALSDPYFNGDDVHKNLLLVVEELPEKQRLVFKMKYFQDLTFAEIAEIIGGSEGGLKANYHHAVKKLKEKISIQLNPLEF